MSYLAWIDFDQADRDRARRIMDLFDNEDSRDELGIGAVRDGLSDLLFPGTSTIQTRLRYMLFVPWIYRMAGAQSGTATNRQEMARALEIRLVDALGRGGESTGVIGSNAREKLKRLPSDVYWAGLLSLGIRRFQGSRHACLEASPGEMNTLWAAGLPQAPSDFLAGDDFATSFRLEPEEAGFLTDRLTHEAPESLFTLLAKNGDAPDCEMVWLHPLRAEWPSSIRARVDHAEHFSRLMHGAALLYNLMLSERAAGMQAVDGSVWHERVETYRQRISDWAVDLPLAHIAEWNMDDLWTETRQTGHDVKPQTRRFVEDWRHSILQCRAQVTEDGISRDLIRQRETRLKGVKSRFRNDGALARWSGASGTSPLNYRWKPVVSDHLRDLAHGR